MNLKPSITTKCKVDFSIQHLVKTVNLFQQGTDENGSSYRMFELSGVNYEEVLEQGDSILVRVIASSSYRGSSYRGFELSGLYCSLIIGKMYIIQKGC